MATKLLLIDCGSDKTPELSACLDQVMVSYDTLSMKELTGLDTALYKGLIISGAPILLSEVATKPYLDLFSFLTTYENPVLGICFGHQILGMMHGGIVSIGAERRNKTTISIEKSSMLFNEIEEPMIMREDHCEEISLPEDFTKLAYSDECSVEAMQHRFKPLFGVQFHPEVSGFPGLQLLKNFCKTCR